MRLAAPSLLLLASLAAGQAPATETEPDRIEAVYRRTPPFSGWKLTRVDRPPFLLFLDEGSESPLRQVVEQRAVVLPALLRVFEERVAKPLKLARRPRPLPVWFVAEAERYQQAGGGRFQARFDDAALHTVVLYDVRTPPPAALHAMLRELVRQLLQAHVREGSQVRLASMPAWLVEGLADCLATRPDSRLTRDKDPGLGQLAPAVVAELAATLGRFSWEKKPKLSWLHHPLAVIQQPDLERYLQATGVKDDSEVQTQIEYHRRCSYAVVSFLMLAYQGHFRPKLEAVLARELHGDKPGTAFEAVFSPEERAALPGLFDAFVRAPAQVVSAKLAPGADRATPEAVTGEPAEEPAERPVRPAPPAVSLSEALVAYRRLDLGLVEDLLADGKDARGQELAAQSDVLDALIGAWGKTALAKRGKARVFLPDKGSALASWKIDGWNDETMELALVQDKARRSLALWEVPAHLFAESALELGVVTTDEQKRALGLLVTLQLRALPDDAQRRAIETRSTRKGFAVQSALCDAAGPMLTAALAVQEARDALATRPPEEVLAKLAERLNALPKSDDLRFVIDERVRPLIEEAFARSKDVLPPLRGKAEQLEGGRVRLSYDWSDPSQLEDWIAVDPVHEGVPIANPLGYDKAKAKATVDASKGQVLLHGQACLRHKLSFRGDLVLRSVFGWRVVEIEGEDVFDVRGPPAWGLFVRKGNTLAACGWASVATFVRGAQRKTSALDDDDRDAAAELVRSGKPLVFRRAGDVLTLGPPEGEPWLRLDVKSLRAEGGLFMIQPQSPSEDKADQPLGIVGATSIEAVIDPIDLVEPRKAFVSKWLARFTGGR